MGAMGGTYVWRLIPAVAGENRFSDGFAGRAEAEAWLGTAWEDLAVAGVEEVELLERSDESGTERALYRMSLADG